MPNFCLQGEVERAPSEGTAWDSGDGAGYRVTFFTSNGCLSGTNSQVHALITSVLAWVCSVLAVQASAVSQPARLLCRAVSHFKCSCC